MVGTSGRRGSEKFVQAARHDDDDEMSIQLGVSTVSTSKTVLHKYAVYMSEQFYFKQFSLAKTVNSRNHSLVLFDYQVLPFQAREDLGAMAMMECSAFPKAPALLESHHQIV